MPRSASSSWAELAAAASREAFVAWGAVLGHGWFREENGFVVGVTGSLEPTLNGIWGAGSNAEPGLVTQLLDEVAAAGVPYCLQLRPAGAHLRVVAKQRRMVAAEEERLMVLEDLGALERPAEREDLSWLKVSSELLEPYLDVFAQGNGIPPSHLAPFVTREVLALSPVDCFIGLVAGSAVTTALAFTSGDAVGIFNVATLVEQRGRGYASAVTVRCIQAARERGARWAYLQASSLGLGVYRRLGFDALERWRTWIAQP